MSYYRAFAPAHPNLVTEHCHIVRRTLELLASPQACASVAEGPTHPPMPLKRNLLTAGGARANVHPHNMSDCGEFEVGFDEYRLCEHVTVKDEAHTCPFRSDVHGDDELHCRCCEACTLECVRDI